MLLKELVNKYIFELKTNNFSKNTINEHVRNLNIYLKFYTQFIFYLTTEQLL